MQFCGKVLRNESAFSFGGGANVSSQVRVNGSRSQKSTRYSHGVTDDSINIPTTLHKFQIKYDGKGYFILLWAFDWEERSQLFSPKLWSKLWYLPFTSTKYVSLSLSSTFGTQPIRIINLKFGFYLLLRSRMDKNTFAEFVSSKYVRSIGSECDTWQVPHSLLHT